MSTVPADSARDEITPAPPAPAARVRGEGRHCGNCGFEDTGHYCSRCGEPLHGTRDTVLQILWADLVEGPVHNGFALLKTTWLMLVRPRRFFDGVLRRQHGMTHVPFFLAPLWRRVSHKPHGVPNAVKYFVLIYTLTFLGSWIVGVNVFPTITIPVGGSKATLPGAVTEPFFLLFVVSAAWMYSRSMSLLLGGRIPTELLTRFMLYLNGLALIPFVAMAVAGTRHRWGFFAALAAWMYVLFVLPQLALPRIFRVSRTRLGVAQAGAAVGNFLLIVVMLFLASAAANLVKPNWNNPARAAAKTPFNPTDAGVSAVRTIRTSVFPLDTMTSLMHLPAPYQPRQSHAGQAARRPRRHARPDARR